MASKIKLPNAEPEPVEQEIQAYFSHSYRADDRAVNLFFWKLFSQESFFFTVDPKSNRFIVPHLELMMRFSDCFIAVVTRRRETVEKVGEFILPEPQSMWTHSPYIAFENYLAELGEKPRLILIESGLDANIFGNTGDVYIFERTTLDKKEKQFNEIVHAFSEKVRAYMAYRQRVFKPSGKAGILVNSDVDNIYHRNILLDIKSTLSTGGYSAEIISPDFDNTQKFIRNISELDLVISEIREPYINAVALSLVQAKGIPSIRISYLDNHQSKNDVKFPKIIDEYKVGDIEPVIFWKKKDELILDLLLHLSKFQQTRTLLDTFEQGRKYFLSAGRKEAKVFISNPHSLNNLALELVKGFQTVNIRFFQYQSSLTIGKAWKDELERELGEFDIFVALINEDYHNSEWCRYELKTAFERWKNKEVEVLPYVIQSTHLPELIKDYIQCAFVQDASNQEVVNQIVSTIDEYLINKDEKTKGDANHSLRKEIFGRGNKWAILVGTDYYEDQANYPKLQVCVKDVLAIQNQLTKNGFEEDRVKIITDKSPKLPTRENILEALKTTADATEPDDLLLFYYSGHGDERKNDSYLVSRNGRRVILEDTGVSISKIKEIMRAAPARAKVLIIDACHSGANLGGKGQNLMSAEFIRRVFEEAKGFAILSSCEQGQLSYEWPPKNTSVFTYYLLEALQGKADFDKKGFVTIQDASRYVTDRVKLWASNNSLSQTPTLQSEIAGDIVLLNYSPEKETSSPA